MDKLTGRTAVVYARLSQERESSTSVEGQLNNARHWAAERGVSITRELVDSGLSGAKARDKAAEALRLLASREASILIVDKVDRFGRRGLADVVALLDVVDSTPGCLVVAISDNLRSDSPDWSLRLGLYAVMARAELDRISQRNKASAARLRAMGRWPGGPTPYGYHVEARPDGGKALAVYAEEATVVQEAAERLVSGEPLFRIVRDFNARSIPSPGYARALKSGRTPSSRPAWRTDALRRLLCSHTMRGYALDGQGDLQRGDDGLPVEVWPPLIPEARWRRVRALLGADEREERLRQRRSGETPAPNPFTAHRPAARILSGVARCGRCGSNLSVRYNGPRANRGAQTFYACPNHSRGSCRGVWGLAHRMEEYVVDEFLTVRGDSPLLTPREVDSPNTVRLAEVEAAIRDTGRAITAHYSPALGERLQRLQQEREELERAPRTPSIVWEESGETYRSRWEAAADDTTARRDLLRANLSVTLQPSPRPRADMKERLLILWRPAGVVGYTEAEGAPLRFRTRVEE